MSEQDLFGQAIDERTIGKHRIQANGYARRPGTGPKGETCRSCRHSTGTGGHNHNYYKCLIIRHRWTKGPGTDILLKSPACEMWAPETKK